MRTIKIAGYKITIKHHENGLSVMVFRSKEKLPLCGTIFSKGQYIK